MERKRKKRTVLASREKESPSGGGAKGLSLWERGNREAFTEHPIYLGKQTPKSKCLLQNVRQTKLWGPVAHQHI
jgi:hypothetical protein